MYSWREKLIKHLDDGTWACDNMKIIINENKPKSLFKYKAVNDENIGYIEKMIKNEELWVSNPREFNDPYDCYMEFDYAKAILPKLAEIYGVRSYALRYSLKGKKLEQIVRNRYEKLLENEVNKTALACLAEDNDNILMWSHYADNHKGICIEYDFNDISKLVEVYPVIYTEYIPDITKNFGEIDPFGILKRFMIKYKVWEYEKEWRIIYKNYEPETSGGNIRFAKIKGIYLGCKIEGEKKKEIIRLAKSKAIKVYQCSMRSDKYKLEYTLLD